MVLHSPYSYPFRGIKYFLTHSQLWCHVLLGLIVMLTFSLVAVILLFLFVFPWQAHAFHYGALHFPEWLSWLLSFLITLLEVATCVLVFSTIFLAYYMDIIFAVVFRQEQISGLNIHLYRGVCPSCYSCVKSFVILIFFRVCLLLITAPLNLIPCVGTIFYIYLNGFYYAWSLHCKYFDILGLNFQQGKHYVYQNRSDYVHFGVIAVLLEMIPLLNFLTPVTNVIGSALWACDIERFAEPLEHPRNFLLAPAESPTTNLSHTNYGSMKSVDEEGVYPPSYNEAVQQQVQTTNIYPTAPVEPYYQEKK
ncbi:unnamed protein product [Didymodactylos carnosus]|uniref:Uncharacterized protein n=1 Tax=Didymodactylos carnosus TaxID=1234261 RepID=A0A813X132_9BILA|nr:unnamed protein product [Didymodactylos carnosus]CAF1186393.1 unnamed protein product [Didymodactylos carnosus]CAF3649353.1 unnamed protein product [Didymodactylos carnosus]CAF3997538.1 unnamed protein product [Didymodactylos carnosus]